MIELTRGQLVCLASQPCTALVRFDDRAPHRIWLEMMEDYAPNRLRVVDGELFGKELAGARRLAIEVTVFQEGAPQFLFDLAGLKEAVAAQMP
ncbi:hypothetical protein MRBLMC3_002888 [Sphingobium sp. LMC3-1-1.1]|uniref:hypothetical protein n=1 Tax=Sphingobium sp. LMC3-1-1.1 TaxID=3135241 RepID=UPI00344365F2